MTGRATAIVILAALLCAGTVVGDDAGRESPFAVGVGARALGMGGAFTPVASDGTALFYNPSGLALLSYQEISFMHMSLFAGTDLNYASWVYPSTFLGGIGIGYMRLSTDDIQTTSNFIEFETIDYANSQFILSYGRAISERLAVGASFKIVNQELGSISDFGTGADLGMSLRLYDNLYAGLMFRDLLQPTIELDSLEEETPRSYLGGLALREHVLSDQVSITAAIELEKITDRSIKVHTGAELWFQEAYALRAGYDRDNLSFGAGMRVQRFRLDYAYKILDYIDDSHRFSLSLQIGKSVEEREAQREAEVERRGRQMLEGEQRRQYEFYREKAEDYFSRFQLDSALAYYQRALAFDSNDEEIIGNIATITEAMEIQSSQREALRDAREERRLTIGTYVDQAQYFLDKESFSAADDMIAMIRELDPDNAAADSLAIVLNQREEAAIQRQLQLAREAERNLQYLKAIEAYNRILELRPGDPEVLAAKQRATESFDLSHQLNVGIALYMLGEYQQARERFEAVLRSQPDQPRARDYLEKIEKALAQPPTLEEIQQDPEIWPVYLEGLRHMRNNEYEKAIDAWSTVLEAYPNNPNTLENIRQARLRLEAESEE